MISGIMVHEIHARTAKNRASLVRSHSHRQLTLDEFDWSFQTELDENNRWVKTRGKDFLKTKLRLVQEREELRIVEDQYGALIWAQNIANSTAHVLATTQREQQASGFNRICTISVPVEKQRGEVLPVPSSSEPDNLHQQGDIKTERVLLITTEEYPLPAPGPKNSQMDLSSLAARLGVALPERYDAIELCIDEVL